MEADVGHRQRLWRAGQGAWHTRRNAVAVALARHVLPHLHKTREYQRGDGEEEGTGVGWRER